MVRCFIFDQIPGTNPSWTLAVFATSLDDARNYVKIYNGGGHFAVEATHGKVNACCGATTAAASKEIRTRNDRSEP